MENIGFDAVQAKKETFIPIALHLEIHGETSSLKVSESAPGETMNCYSDRLEIDGKVVTDAEAVAFIKRLAGYYEKQYSAQAKDE